MKDMEKFEGDLKELKFRKEENQNDRMRLSELEPNYIQYLKMKEEISSLEREIKGYKEGNKNFERQKGAAENMGNRISEMEKWKEIMKGRLRDKNDIDTVNGEYVPQQVEKLREEIKRSGEAKSEENAKGGSGGEYQAADECINLTTLW